MSEINLQSQEDSHHALGAVISFLSYSHLHKFLFLSDLEWLVMPPVALGQYRLLCRNGAPIAYASWACVSEDVDARLEAGNLRLRPGDWASGSQLWLIDFVVAADDLQAVLVILSATVFEGVEIRILRGQEMNACGDFESRNFHV
ncbi:toxin-activating lysine-acyltransferase [Ferrovibrio sp.]|uniref:toxin-activating lysine-acyltransferase n=1 Tax=Ferrovibrio sp. TaxID=1917215 RepID=UPI001B6E3291|nr:toxin-activating lysine-acyltransferase [Ferrovibrio sp.]MBP7065361.1 toxin-activating lysine-acyltransferase [Ferrovibrio sp.]